MKTVICSLSLAALAFWTTAACVAQQPTGAATLETSVSGDDSKAQTAGTVRPAGTLVRPQDGVQHPDLDKAWTEYDADVAKVTEFIKASIAKQFDAATEKGDLDAAEKWQIALQKFDESGQLPSESGTRSVASAATSELKAAKDSLGEAYGTVVKALTREKKIAEAKAVREESESLLAMNGPAGFQEMTASRDKGEWIVLFRSSNPTHWNTSITSEDHFAVPVSKTPRGVRFLRLKRAKGGSFAIIPITSEQLGLDGATSDGHGWAGAGLYGHNARHLGIYALRSRPNKGDIAIALHGGNLGWGFGHNGWVDDRQYFSWAGMEIPESIFEIAVTCGDLTAFEKKHLLSK